MNFEKIPVNQPSGEDKEKKEEKSEAKNGLSRRDFIKKGFLGALAVGIGSKIPDAVEKFAEPTEENMDEGEDKLEREKAEVEKIIEYHLNRLLIDKIDKSKENIKKFTDFTRETESSSNPMALNKTTSAAGSFQFVTDSVLPAINRMKKTKEFPEWAKELENDYKKIETLTKKEKDEKHKEFITSLSDEQQTALFLSDILEKRVEKSGYGDELIKKIIDGDIEAMKELYYKGHHTLTGTDEENKSTIDRVNKIFK